MLAQNQQVICDRINILQTKHSPSGDKMIDILRYVVTENKAAKCFIAERLIAKANYIYFFYLHASSILI